ncbi:hypothetical protein ACIQI7_01345 [Kitasatospora sp. NPDC092039]|uniref:hypothetical protein n=1 Tax=Kitasatospora sp. NPDC092039 TaxID=3364086 RepID=UPI0037FF81B9
MVFRIHFTAQDLARTRLADPMPFAELNAAVRALRRRSHAARLDAWRRGVLGRLPGVVIRPRPNQLEERPGGPGD